jgi:hypothetical protein
VVAPRLWVVALGPTSPIQLNWFTVQFALDSNEGVQKLVGDVGKDRGATRRDAILDDEDKELGKELVDLLGGLQVVELAEEVGGKVDINGLCGLELQCRMAKTKAITDGTKAALASRNGGVMAFRIGLGQRYRRM